MNLLCKKLNAVKASLKKTADPESEQAFVRVIIALLLILIFCIPWGAEEQFSDLLNSTIKIVILVASSVAIALFTAICINPKVSPTRRVIGIFLDLISLSVLMATAAQETVYLFVFYLWVILGNGFRFGVNYLYISMVIGIIGFISAIYWGGYWQTEMTIAISLLIVITLIPLYSIFLIKKLYAAIDMAEKANQAKTRFLANMSHELRTPLNGVLGLGDLLIETKLDQEQYNLVSTMQSSAKTLLGLIEKVLDISKIEAGKITINKGSVDLHTLINSVIDTQKLIAKAKGLTVILNIDSDVPLQIEADQQYIRQVLVNLIGNAIKFTDQGTIKVHIYLVSEQESATVIRFDIKDTGIGIDKKSLLSVFDDFTQVGKAAIRHINGTGLGTTISKELVELMGGKIGVESELDQGSTFWFELPFTILPNVSLTVNDSDLLIMATDTTKKSVQSFLRTWDLSADFAKSPVQTLRMQKNALGQARGYKILLVDRFSLQGMSPIQFSNLLASEKLLDGLSLVLLNPEPVHLHNEKIRQDFISVIADINDKRSLFNALHTAQRIDSSNKKVVSLSDFYDSQNGAKALNILVAEDNKVNQQVLSGILKRAGHSIVIANDGEQALDKLSTDLEHFDLLIVDKNMPKCSGDEVVQALRFMDTSNKLPIIMLTADATPEARALGISLGVDEFLTKPIDSHDLLKKIAVISNTSSSTISNSTISNTAPTPTSIANLKKQHADNEWYNSAVLEELFQLDNDVEFMTCLITGFTEDGNKHIKYLQQAIIGDYLQFRESLHALKGAASELGADRLVEICRKGEECKPYDIGTPKLTVLVGDIEYNFTKTVEALNNALVKSSTEK